MAKSPGKRTRSPDNLIKRNGVWYVKKTVAGQPFKRTLETGDLGIAKARRDKILSELEATKWGEVPRRTFNDAAVRFGTDHYKHLKPKSAARYTTSIANLLDVLDGKFLDEVSGALLSEFERRRLDEDEVDAATVRRDLACLSSIFSRAEEWEWARYNPVKPFLRSRAKAGLTENPPRERYLSHDEESAVLSHTLPGMVFPTIFAIDTGLRKEEQLALEWRDVNLKAREITIRREISKTGRQRVVPIQKRCLSYLKAAWSSRHAESPYIFTATTGTRYTVNSNYFWESLQKACFRAKIAEHVEWHDLRRTCGCRLLQDRKLSMLEVSKWLGHSSIKVTERTYAFLAKDALHAALDQSTAKVIKFNRRA